MEESLEYILTNYYKDQMMACVESSTEKFDELIQLACSTNKKHSPRAAWLLANCTKENDKRIEPHLPKIIEIISAASDGQMRDLLYIIRKMQLNEEHEGMVFDICVDIWSATSKIPSVRYHAFLFILQIAENYPDLISEITLLSEDHYIEPLSPGIKHSIKRKIKAFLKKHKPAD